MKVIDRSPSHNQSDNSSTIIPIQGPRSHTFSRLSEEEAHQICINSLAKVLNDDYVLLRNIILSNLEISIPLILVGPGGLFVLQVSNLTGSYRAKEDNWLNLENLKNPKPVQPNLLIRTGLMARAVDVFLSKNKVETFNAQGVLLCANPRMFVECMHPIVQVVMIDTIELFGANLSKETLLANPDKRKEIIDALVPPRVMDVAFTDEPSENSSLPRKSQYENQKLSKASRRLTFKFSRGQLITLIVMALFEIIALTFIILLTVKSLAL